MTKRALLSVSDKTGLLEFAQGLLHLGYELIATGGTQKHLENHGLEVTPVEEITHFPEMLDGRVKTLHPAIHGGLLAKRNNENHVAQIKEQQIMPIDVVCINLYPFKATISNPNVTLEEAIEQIDIGGPALLRSSAKNYVDVAVVVDPCDYAHVLDHLHPDTPKSDQWRQSLAVKVFQHTAYYDGLIAQYLFNQTKEQDYPEYLALPYHKKMNLSYGENPHQTAALYEEGLPSKSALTQAQQLSGKALSYNNIRDLDAAYKIVQEFSEPAFVAVKHSNPCGVGIGDTITLAFERAYEADPVSIFGGILCCNREIDLQTAEKIHPLFIEAILAPSFSEEALNVLSSKKNLRLLTLPMEVTNKKQQQILSVSGGILIQELDQVCVPSQSWTCVTKVQPTSEELVALEFAWKVVKHVKSNAIVIANEHQTLGIGAGQMNRVGSVELACNQQQASGLSGVLASDAFFPMPDSIEQAAKAGIKAIVQPGGSIKDQAVIEMADQLGIAMLLTKERHFCH